MRGENLVVAAVRMRFGFRDGCRLDSAMFPHIYDLSSTVCSSALLLRFLARKTTAEQKKSGRKRRREEGGVRGGRGASELLLLLESLRVSEDEGGQRLLRGTAQLRWRSGSPLSRSDTAHAIPAIELQTCGFPRKSTHVCVCVSSSCVRPRVCVCVFLLFVMSSVSQIFCVRNKVHVRNVAGCCAKIH